MTEVAELVQDVLVEGGFDVPTTRILRWLNTSHRTMVVRAQCFRRSLELGPTVALQQDYVMPAEVVELTEVVVAGFVYGEGRHQDIANGAASRLWLGRLGGISTRDDDSAGLPHLALYPIPTTSGEPITCMAVCLPPNLSESDDTTLKIPKHFQDALVNGAVAIGLARVENRPDLAVPKQQAFEAACTELEAQTRNRFRGRTGPVQIRVQGINA